ncbi:MAG: anti-sigma factor family protein [Phycisphaerae bacterium]
MASIDRDNLDEFLSAYLDDELGDADRTLLERLIAQDSYARGRLEQLRQTVELVRTLPRRGAPPEMLDELTAGAERELLLGDLEELAPLRRPWWSSAKPLLSAAAVLAITVGGGWYVLRSTGGPTGPLPSQAPGRMLASADSEKESVSRPASEESTPAELAGDMAAPDSPTEKSPDRQPDSLSESDTIRALRAKPEPADQAEASSAPPGTMIVLGVKPAEQLDALKQKVVHLNRILSLEKKLETGQPLTDLVNHRFANETNTIVVQARDPVDERLAREQIKTFALANHLQGLTTDEAGPTVSPSRPLIIEGRPNRNFDQANQTQFVVRLRPDQLMDLVQAVSAGDRMERQISMALGPAVARNTTETKNLLAQVQPPPERRAGRRPQGNRIANRQRAVGNLVEQPNKAMKGASSAESRSLTQTDAYTPRKVRSKNAKKDQILDKPEGLTPPAPQNSPEPTLGPTKAQAKTSPDDAASPPSPLMEGFRMISELFIKGGAHLQGPQPAPESPTPVPDRPGEIVKNQRKRLSDGDSDLRQPETDTATAAPLAAEDLITVVVQIVQPQPDTDPSP